MGMGLSFRWECDGNGNEVIKMGGNWYKKSVPAHLYRRPVSGVAQRPTRVSDKSADYLVVSGPVRVRVVEFGTKETQGIR